jgi:DNA-binding MarR family transcriptional regulator
MENTQTNTLENLIAQEASKFSLTANEQKVLTAFINGLYAEPGFSDVDAIDLAKWTGISTRSIRGVLSSLVKKGYLNIDEANDAGYVIIYLAESKYYLHPEWKNDSPWHSNPENKTYEQIYSPF